MGMVYTARHGQTDYNLKMLYQGAGIDVSLNSKGRQDAMRVKEIFKDVSLDVIICSPLKRAQESILPLAKEKKFEVLYDLIGKHIINYAKKIGYNEEKIDFYYQRSWATVSRKNEYIKYHNHSQSHLSFAYYLKKDKDQGAINFHDNFKHNEIVSGTFESTSTRTANFIKLNIFIR